MRILLDTNVILRVAHPLQSDHVEAVSAVNRIRMRGDEPTIVPQVLYEYWVVATRPIANNGMGLSASRARLAIDEFTRSIALMLDERGIYSIWLNLVSDREVQGKRAHDTRLVAAMRRHNISHLLTFNKPDFQAFHEITVIAPNDLM